MNKTHKMTKNGAFKIIFKNSGRENTLSTFRPFFEVSHANISICTLVTKILKISTRDLLMLTKITRRVLVLASELSLMCLSAVVQSVLI